MDSSSIASVGASSLYQGLSGMQNSAHQLNQNAQVLATPKHPDQTQALVDLNQNETQFQANAQSVKAYDELLGSLIDVMA